MAEQGLHDNLADRLLAWYDRAARDLPWRARPGERADPYAVWLSELMLQQTTVGAVRPYFEKVLARWPSVEALAAAPLDDVLKAWAGLGYYARARNLHACAKAVVRDRQGRFPTGEAELRQLPGIGPYTAAAIAAIAFGGRHAAVDGNVERVMARRYAITDPLPDAKPDIRARAQALVPEQRAGDFAQALMDLGATICTPRSPACGHCPWLTDCRGHAAGLASELPRKRARKPIPVRHGIAYWVEHEGQVLLRRRPEQGLLGGMMEVPTTAWEEGAPRPAPPLRARWRKLAERVRHTFTHFHLELEVRIATRLEANDRRLGEDYRWVRRAEIGREALPTVMRKVVAAALRA
jgi:A/G-specific adenine glycosylase